MGRDRAPTESNVPVMAVTTGLNVGSMLLWSPVLSLILRDLGANDLQVSLAAAFWAAMSALVQYGGGRIADRVGRVPVIVLPTYLSGVALIGAAAMPTWLPFALVYAFYAVGNALQSPVFSAFIGESVPAHRRGTAFGVVEFAISVGLILGPLAGSRLLPVTGAKPLLIITGLTLLGTGLARHILCRETNPASSGKRAFAFGQVFSGRLRLVLVTWMAFAVVQSLTLWGPFVALHASDAQGLSRAQISLFFALASIVSAGVSLVAGHAVNRFGTYAVFGCGAASVAAAFVFWAAQRSLWAVLLGYVLGGAAFQLAMVASDAFRVTAVPDEMRGSAWGAIGTMAGLLSAAVIPVAGWLRSVVGWSAAPFYLAIVAAAVACWGSWKLARHREDEVGAGPESAVTRPAS
jgi:MFS family permease